MIHVLFDFSSGLSKVILAERGVFESIEKHVNEITSIIGSVRKQDGCIYWDVDSNYPESLSDNELCTLVLEHNQYVARLYRQFDKWFEHPVREGEQLTPKNVKAIWHGLRTLPHPPMNRWTTDYYRAIMDELYAALRGHPTDQWIFNAKKLTTNQAREVVLLLSCFVDRWQLDLDVAKGEDELTDKDNHVYCEKCGCVTFEHVDACKKRGCPYKE